MQFDEEKLWAALGEETGVADLVQRFYAQVPSDPILGPMYPQAEFAGAEERLRDFLAFRLGGESRYIETRGHPRLRIRHAPFAVNQAARDRWIELMSNALASSELEPDKRASLLEFFEQVASFLINRPD